MKFNNNFYRKLIITYILIISFFIIPHISFAKKKVYKEPEVISALLYNIAKFVDWGNKDTIKIFVYGKKSVIKYFDKLNGLKLNKKRIIIEKNNFKDCDIIFFDKSIKDSINLNKIILSVANRKVLTASNINNFALKYGILEFYTYKKRIRFKINIQHLKRSKLYISSKILELSEIVKR